MTAHSMTMTARIAPATAPFTPEAQAILDKLPSDWQPPFRLFTTLAHDADLLRRFTRGAPSYRPGSKVPLRLREVLLLRVTANCRCAYEWGLRVHYFAASAGLDQAQLHASVHGAISAPCWQPEDRLMLRLADALHHDCAIDEGLWEDLCTLFDADSILELLLLAGYYRTVAYIANGLRLPLEPGVGRDFPPAGEGMSARIAV